MKKWESALAGVYITIIFRFLPRLQCMFALLNFSVMPDKGLSNNYLKGVAKRWVKCAPKLSHTPLSLGKN